MLSARCSSCNIGIQVPEKYAGLNVKCPKCGGAILVSALELEQATASPSTANVLPTEPICTPLPNPNPIQPVASNNRMLLLITAFGGGIVVLLLVIVVLMLTGRKEQAPVQVLASPAPQQTPSAPLTPSGPTINDMSRRPNMPGMPNTHMQSLPASTPLPTISRQCTSTRLPTKMMTMDPTNPAGQRSIRVIPVSGAWLLLILEKPETMANLSRLRMELPNGYPSMPYYGVSETLAGNDFPELPNTVFAPFMGNMGGGSYYGSQNSNLITADSSIVAMAFRVPNDIGNATLTSSDPRDNKVALTWTPHGNSMPGGSQYAQNGSRQFGGPPSQFVTVQSP